LGIYPGIVLMDGRLGVVTRDFPRIGISIHKQQQSEFCDGLGKLFHFEIGMLFGEFVHQTQERTKQGFFLYLLGILSKLKSISFSGV